MNLSRTKIFKAKLNSFTNDELFEYLIIGPTGLLVDGHREKAYILIDGLDEASDYNSEFAEVLVKKVRRLPNWIRFIITS